jgi:hypothetical protein
MANLTKEQLEVLKARGVKFHKAPFKVRSVDTESTLVVIGGTEEATKHFAKERASALRRGDAVIEADGRRIWREREVVFSPEGSTESDHYEWHEDGRRIRCVWYEYTAVGGQTTKRQLRSVWVDFEQAF